jgi:hypothetical protein
MLEMSQSTKDSHVLRVVTFQVCLNVPGNTVGYLAIREALFSRFTIAVHARAFWSLLVICLPAQAPVSGCEPP